VLLTVRLHGCQRKGTSAEPGVLNEKDLVKAEGGGDGGAWPAAALMLIIGCETSLRSELRRQA